ncbi:RNA-binding protein 41-like isoform X1 [Montipora foliosa]|uniref:RNA-binding protein 41-like isoform X1 n=1 Tax=Montipora foliosa TaxID=591990 RepID=UPI0035F1DE9B
MVGGSVSGKPFKPDPTSYEQTGIPCGNPARYQSRGVIRMNRSDAKPFTDQRLGIPGTGTESEADQHLKGLVKNQLDTNITLQSQLSRKKSFQSSSTYAPFCPDRSGALSLEDYQSLQKHEQYAQTLKECGFGDEEIQFKLEQEGHLPKAPKRSRYGANPAAEQEKLKDLETRIKKHEEALSVPDLYSNVRVLSRHALEVEQSLQKGTPKGSSLSHLVQQQQQQATPVNDPLLQTLLEQDRILSKSKQMPSSSTIQKKNSEFSSSNSSETVDNNSEGCSTISYELADEGCSQSGAFSGQGETHSLLTNIRSIDERQIIENRLSLDQIKEIPKFMNYQPGEPNKVLFIKNLHHKTTEADLVSLFIRFQGKSGSRIIFRLMKGKMNGQAFVTLPDIPSATAALNLVNGYIFKGKPVIIQYGRQRNENDNDRPVEKPL